MYKEYSHQGEGPGVGSVVQEVVQEKVPEKGRKQLAVSAGAGKWGQVSQKAEGHPHGCHSLRVFGCRLLRIVPIQEANYLIFCPLRVEKYQIICPFAVFYYLCGMKRRKIFNELQKHLS